ncbi:MAG: NAD-dependent deacylase [Saprospiraceae bacterium]|nr:NAD-dependent deacylase [Saprospiraceae bacterium]MCB9311665.1 NAD-dependent deacylase [Lewinellaceae bacterium]
MKRIVVLTGAGISAESGISTFRDAGGLWEGHDVMEVASPEGWQRNPDLVLEFYNQRRRQALEVHPNKAHTALVDLESRFDVQVITQNVDDLHERAGSRSVLHLHGELLKVRSTGYPDLIYDWRKDLHRSDVCEEGFPLRPHIVWFGEEVPALEYAIPIIARADIVLIVGTSLQVYPAAGLIHFAPSDTPIYYVDPRPAQTQLPEHRIFTYPMTATEGVPALVAEWLQKK